MPTQQMSSKKHNVTTVKKNATAIRLSNVRNVESQCVRRVCSIPLASFVANTTFKLFVKKWTLHSNAQQTLTTKSATRTNAHVATASFPFPRTKPLA